LTALGVTQALLAAFTVDGTRRGLPQRDMLPSTQIPAVAVFVKTPGLSPVKTRLAVGIGREAAEEFYRLAVEATRAVVRTAARQIALQPWWAIAEPEGLSDQRWSDFKQIGQGPGDLGDRLSRTYDALLAEHGVVVFIGADSPQMNPADLTMAVIQVSQGNFPFALGCCPDGGFHTFAGREPVPFSAWSSTPWSTSETAQVFHKGLRMFGEVAPLRTLCDVDVKEDLWQLAQELATLPSPQPEQSALLKWLSEWAQTAQCVPQATSQHESFTPRDWRSRASGLS
jgi:glycosyltransferase A (GT-A) superfamily protein (DUF2064 family)